MTGCQIVVEFLTENSPCCVLLENGGDDLDGAVACLVQICVDQAFHTIEGFCRLVNKEWVQNRFVSSLEKKCHFDRQKLAFSKRVFRFLVLVWFFGFQKF